MEFWHTSRKKIRTEDQQATTEVEPSGITEVSELYRAGAVWKRYPKSHSIKFITNTFWRSEFQLGIFIFR